MKKIIIVGFHSLREQLSAIKEVLDGYYFEVYFYPLFKFAYDATQKIDNYKENMNQFIKKINADIILWWFLDVPFEVFDYVKVNNPSVYFILFNSDDPLNVNNELLKKCKIFDLVMVPSLGCIEQYKVQCENVIHNSHPIWSKMFYRVGSTDMIPDNLIKQYKCDISILCTSLRESKELNRKKIIQDIVEYSKKSYRVFKIFGPGFLKESYPDNYGGIVEYDNLNLLFNLSKINISLHTDCNKSLCLTHTDLGIISSGGLLFIDQVKDLETVLKHNEHCIIIDKEGYIKQIDSILSTYEQYTRIKEKVLYVAKNFTTDNFVKKMFIGMSSKLFSAEIYSEFYDLKLNKKELYEHWINEGIDRRYMFYNFKVPDNFNSKAYVEVFSNIKNKSAAYIYYHWYKCGRDSKYTIDTKAFKNPMLSTSIPMENYCDLHHIFETIADYNTDKVSKGLRKLSVYAMQNPTGSVNKALNQFLYLNM